MNVHFVWNRVRKYFVLKEPEGEMHLFSLLVMTSDMRLVCVKSQNYIIRHGLIIGMVFWMSFKTKLR